MKEWGRTDNNLGTFHEFDYLEKISFPYDMYEKWNQILYNKSRQFTGELLELLEKSHKLQRRRGVCYFLRKFFSVKW